MESMEKVDVLLAGATLPGVDLDRAVDALVKLAGITPEQARLLITGGKPRLVKRNLDPDAGKNLMDRFAAMGIKTIMRPATGPHNTAPAPVAPPPRQAAPAASPAPAPTPAPVPQTDPRAADELPRTAARPERAARDAVRTARPEPEAEEHNPYAPPKASLVRERRGGAGEWRDVGVVVPAGHGLKWIRDAWRLFRERPGTWCGAVILYFLCFIPLNMIPVLGGLAGAFLNPVFGGGLALMAHDQSEGEDIRATGLFRGFGPRFGQLALIGLLLLLAALGLGIVAALLVGGQLFVAFRSGNPDPALLEPIAGRLLMLFPLFLLWFIPMMMAMFFAPTLVAAGGHGAWQAMLAGVGAGIRNWKAGLVNGIGLLGFGLGLGIVFGALTAVLGLVLGRDSMGVFVILFPVLWLLLCLPLVATLTLMGYTATRDIFYEEGEG